MSIQFIKPDVDLHKSDLVSIPIDPILGLDPTQPIEKVFPVDAWSDRNDKERKFCFGILIATPNNVKLPCDLFIKIRNSTTNDPSTDLERSAPMSTPHTHFQFGAFDLNALKQGFWELIYYYIVGATTYISHVIRLIAV